MAQGKTPADKERIRGQLRTVGLFCIIAGLVVAAIGLVDLLLGNGGARLWMILTGLPLAAVGGRMLQLSNTQPKGRK